MNVRLLTFGALGGTRDGAPQEWLQTHSVRAALLVHIAVERQATRDAIQHLLWPEATAHSASHRLNQSLYELRRLLEEGCIETRSRVVRAGAGLTADTNDFEQAFGAGRYDVAVELYNGPFLDGVHLVDTNEFELWVDARRARYARMFRQACRGRVSDLFAGGNPSAALAVAGRWAAVDPLDDEAQHRSIELLAATGRRAEALRQFGSYVKLLQAEGLEPLEETRQLVAGLEGSVALTVGDGAARLALVPAESGPAAKRAPTTSRWTRLGADVDPGLEADLAPRFQILRQIGFGAAAQVYVVRDTMLRRLAAVKVPRPEIVEDPAARTRFEREARAAARLVHPNVVTVYEVTELQNGTPCLVTEYVEGRNLADLLVAEGPMTQRDAASVLLQLASALAHAHSRRVVHRDVRPSNVVWTRETDRAVLMDFGIAAAVPTGSQIETRITAPGDVLGDPRFVSPEQLRGEAVTPAADMYSLGALGYCLIAGCAPFGKDAPLGDTAAERVAEPLLQRRPDANPELAALLHRCLSPHPEHRPSAREFTRALENIAGIGAVGPATAATTAATSADGAFGGLRGFIHELERRSVYQVGLVYATTAFVILQGSDLVLPSLRITRWYDVLVAVTLGGFPVALVLAWLFDFTAAGVSRTRTAHTAVARAQQRVFQIVGLAASLALAAIIGWYILAF